MANELYNEFLDMDAGDYAETKENDLNFINSLIELYGVNNARDILKAYFE